MRSNLRWFFPLVVCLAFAGSMSVLAGPEDEDLQAKLRAVLVKNMEEAQRKDVDASMECIHTQSPVYASTKRIMDKLNQRYELKYELSGFRYIGRDGEYAIARGRQKSVKVSGPAFRDNELDSVYIFRQEDGVWKLWQQAVLEMTVLETQKPQKPQKPE